MHVNASARLTLLGTATVAIYGWLVIRYPLARYANADRPFDLEQLSRGREADAVVYVILLAALFAIFGVALKTAPDTPRATYRVAGFGALAGLVLIGLYPLTATDIFHYAMRAREQVIYGVNPLVVAPIQFQADPLTKFLGEWADLPSPYGPIWELLGGALLRLGFTDRLAGLIAFKVVAWLGYLTTTLLIVWGTRANTVAVLLFAWNPLSLLQGPGNGHNDLLMVALMTAAIVCWERRHWWVAAVALLTTAFLIKLPALLLAPLLMVTILRVQPSLRQKVMVLVVSAAVVAFLVLAAYAPFWPLWEATAGLQMQFTRGRTYSIVAAVRLGLSYILPGDLSARVPTVIGQAVLIAVYGGAMWRVWQRTWRLPEAGFWVFFTYLLTAPGFHIWYATWIVPLAALALPTMPALVQRSRMRWRTFLLSLTSEFSILMFYLLWRWVLNGVWLPKPDWFGMHLLTIPWQFGLPLFLPLLIRAPRQTAPEYPQPEQPVEASLDTFA